MGTVDMEGREWEYIGRGLIASITEIGNEKPAVYVVDLPSLEYIHTQTGYHTTIPTCTCLPIVCTR